MKKCVFAQPEIEFCGFIVNKEGVFTHPEKVEAIRKWPTPGSAKDIRSFLGLAGFYQRFVPNFANTAAPLTSLLKKDVAFSWKEEQEKAFRKLQDDLAKQTTLAYPDLSRPFILHVDASLYAVGATLSQETADGSVRLVTCVSKKLNPAERNYPTHEREMLALVHALKKWKHYLMGSRTLVYTDNSPLRYWRTAENLSPRQIRWLSYIQMFDIEVVHLPGKDNTAADALSRLQPMQTHVDDDWTTAYLQDVALKRPSVRKNTLMTRAYC